VLKKRFDSLFRKGVIVRNKIASARHERRQKNMEAAIYLRKNNTTNVHGFDVFKILFQHSMDTWQLTC